MTAKRGISSPPPGEAEGQHGEGLAGTLSRSVAAFSEEEPVIRAHNSRRLTTQSRIDASQAMADRASHEEQSAIRTAEELM